MCILLGLEEDSDKTRLVELVDPWLAQEDSEEAHNRTSIKLPWATICTQFHSLYCNWDPQLFEFSAAFHLYVLVTKCERSGPVLTLSTSATIERLPRTIPCILPYSWARRPVLSRMRSGYFSQSIRTTRLRMSIFQCKFEKIHRLVGHPVIRLTTRQIIATAHISWSNSDQRGRKPY